MLICMTAVCMNGMKTDPNFVCWPLLVPRTLTVKCRCKRFDYSVDIGITTITTPAVDIAALCLKLVAGSDQCSDAYIGQQQNQLTIQQLQYVS